MHSRIGIARFIALLVLVSPALSKAVEPALIFSDQMVLQRDVAVPVWGRAEPGEQVTVTFAGVAGTHTPVVVVGVGEVLDADGNPVDAQPCGTALCFQAKGGGNYRLRP